MKVIFNCITSLEILGANELGKRYTQKANDMPFLIKENISVKI
jgi:hypothetical protein